MKYIVYLTINKVNNKIYIGVHQTEDPYKFDGYLGCGLKINDAYLRNHPQQPFHFAVKKYGADNFIRKTIAVFDTIKEALNLEKLLVNQEFISRSDTYNATLGGGIPPKYEKRIYQYTLDGKFVREWNSITEAALYFRCGNATIGAAVRNRTVALKHLWTEYKYEQLDINQFKLNMHKCKVYLYDKNGNFIMEFKSISDCAKYLDSTPAQIKNYIILKIKFHSQYYISDFKTDKYNIPEKDRYKGKHIYQYDKEGNFIKEWNSITEIQQYFGKQMNIVNNMKLGRCTEGFQWSFTKEPCMKKLEHKSGRIRKVGKYDLNGNLIEVFKSICAARKDTSGCINALYGRQKTSGGYIWKFIEE